MSEEALFHEALAKSPVERAAFLDAACAGQPELRAAVEALLAAHGASASLLDQPAADPNRTGAYTPEPLGTTGVHVPTDAQPGYVIAGRYTLEQKIGEGGMGEVWVAKQTEPVKRKVALKLIKAGMDSKAVLQRFEAERQALALMDHPHIAKVLDGGLTADRHPFFVMELVNGLPLNKFCDEAKLTPKERLELFVPICQAVQHAHQKGIIHRDLKPGNILVTLIDGRPVPKVIDFGVAKATAGKLTDESLSTNFGAVVGTLEYMAPEQAGYSGEDIDTRADIYSLGVILYEMLTGLRPIDAKRFHKAALTEMIRIIREEEPSKPSTRLSTDEALPSLAAIRQTEPRKLMAMLRGELDWVVMKCLEKQRDRRYETANGLARDIQRYLADEPVEARPPSFGYRAGKFLRRHKGPVAAASLVLLTLLGGIAGTSWGFYREAQRAEGERLAKLDAQEKRRLAEQATAAEKVAKEQAQKRLAQIEKGVELFAGMLRGIDPRRSEAAGGEPLYVQLRRRAEHAADALDAEAVGDPLAVARLQTYLGETLCELGNAAKAEEVLEKARAIRVQELGVDHPHTLNTLHTLAGAYQDVGKLPKAIDLLEKVRDARVKQLGADHEHTLTTLQSLAVAYHAAGRLPEAIALYEQLRDAAVKKWGADHINTLTTLNALAVAYRAVGRLPEAITLYEQIREVMVKQLGAEHPSTLRTLNNLAVAYRAAGKLPEAIALSKQVRDARVKMLGADHPSTLIALNNLALAYQAGGNTPEAIALFEQAATGFAKRRFQHEHAGAILGYTIDAYEQAGQFARAEDWRRQWLAAVKQKDGADSRAYASGLAALGLNLLRQQKWTDAEAVLRESLALRAKQQPDDWTTFDTRSLLGGALVGQKKYAEAEQLLRAGYEGMKQREKTIPPQGKIRLTEALERLVQLYDAMGKKDDAAKWRKELEAIQAAQKQPERRP